MLGMKRCGHGEVEQVMMLNKPGSAAGEWALSTILTVAEPITGSAFGTGGGN